jgi:hypothetical protein
LFWQTYTIGSLWTPAKFSASWKPPMLVAPSPKYATTIESLPCLLSPIATPVPTFNCPAMLLAGVMMLSGG